MANLFPREAWRPDEPAVVESEGIRAVQALVLALPVLATPRVLADLELNPRGQCLILDKVHGKTVEEAAQQLALYLDETAWKDLEPLLREIARTKPKLDRTALLGREGSGSLWSRALMAALGSSRVKA